MTQSSSNSSQFKMVNIEELNIDPEAQRRLDKAWVRARISKFNVDRLGYIVINIRNNGKKYVVDGQHRVSLLRAVGWGDQKIHAEIFEGLSQSEEAALFNARNDRKAVRRYDKFRVSVTAGDPVSRAIDKLVKEHGMVISDQLKDGHIVAVDALESVYHGAGIASPKEGPKALTHALTVLLRAWGNQSSAVNGQVIRALGMVFLRYNGEISESDLIKKLAPFPGGAPGLLGKGRSMQELRGRPLSHCIASVVVDIYNKGRRVGKLEAWES